MLVGQVTSVAPRHVKLNVDGDLIYVEVDDYDWDADGYKLAKGDQVIVRGKIDHDFLERKKVEASSIYVKNIDTYFYANSDDEEGAMTYATYLFDIETLPDGASLDVVGKVVSVGEEEFTVDTGWRRLKVDTDEMKFDPLDEVGLIKINKGDKVKVAGVLDKNFWSSNELEAKYIIEY
tara:strand:- start:1201 stop:1734 length:534 start_codon:yes stop_codon:yes gene_type:complete